jgi:RNA-directed DNA polymerase
MARVKETISDGRVLSLVEAFLEQGILDGLEQWTPNEGTPQGAVLSPLLANLYLNPLDHLMEAEGYEMVRYADDFVLLCQTEGIARRALEMVQIWTKQAGLQLHPEKTHVVDATQKGGFDFLGYHFERGMRWPRQKSMKKLRDTLRPKTKRCNGHSLERIIVTINPVLRGWFNYFKHSHPNVFPQIDGWVRGRLRSILRKRRKGKGRARGDDHHRWPNDLFAAHGLFSLQAAHKAVCQPSPR